MSYQNQADGYSRRYSTPSQNLASCHLSLTSHTKDSRTGISTSSFSLSASDEFWNHILDGKSNKSLNAKVEVGENKSRVNDSFDIKPSPFFTKYEGALQKVQDSKLHWKKVLKGQACQGTREENKSDKSVLCETGNTFEQGSSHHNSCSSNFSLYGGMMNSENSLSCQSPTDCDGILDMSASLDLCSQFSPGIHHSTYDMINPSDIASSSTKITDSAYSTTLFKSFSPGPGLSNSNYLEKKGSSSKRNKNETNFLNHEADLESEQLPHSTSLHQVTPRIDSGLCQVCDDVAAGFYCGAFVCEACKKFFIRASKQEKQKFVCLRQGTCKITKESRVQCQYCRYQKCCQLQMYYPGEGKRTVSTLKVSGIPCRVCGAPSSGFHFGALTCEGCKGFFRRMVKEREPGMYKCSASGMCEISTHTRNMCKACRYKKCINIGMSVEGSRIGRQPNAVKHAISCEVKKHIMEQAQASSALMASSSCPSLASPLTPAVHFADTPSEAAYNPRRREQEPPCHKDIKEESTHNFSFSGIELTEVIPGVVVKEEPQDLRPEEQALESNLQVASEQLRLMCNTERAKSDVFDPSAFSTLDNTWKCQMKHFDFHAQSLIRFVKKVPDFRTLQLDDQVVLLQNGIYPIVILNLARDYDPHTGFYNFFNFSRPEARVIKEMCPEYVVLTQHFEHMGLVVKNMNMTEMELTLLSCIILLDPDCPGLKSPQLVKDLQEFIIDFFQIYETRQHADGMMRFGELLLRISELVLANMQHMATISSFLTHHPHLEVPQLFKEMFFSG